MANNEAFYRRAYSSNGSNSWSKNPDRQGIVRSEVTAIQRQSTNILDIGCGDGFNTTWVQAEGLGRWTGIDILDEGSLGLAVPVDGRFAIADASTIEGWRHPYLRERYDIIVDQGAVFVSLTDDEERSHFLCHVAERLKPGGRFIGLLIDGPFGVEHFPDGRTRMRMQKNDLPKLLAEHPSLSLVKTYHHEYQPGNFNPLSTLVRVMHIVLEKLQT